MGDAAGADDAAGVSDAVREGGGAAAGIDADGAASDTGARVRAAASAWRSRRRRARAARVKLSSSIRTVPAGKSSKLKRIGLCGMRDEPWSARAPKPGISADCGDS
jgi:hypothetical protein